MQHYLRNVEPLNASLLERRLLQCELISRLCCTTIFHLRLSVASRLKDVSSHVQRGQTTIGEENIQKKLNAERLGHDRSKLRRGTHRKQYPVTNSDTPTKTNASKKRSGVSQENLHSPAQHNTAPHSTHFIGVIAQTPRRGERSCGEECVSLAQDRSWSHCTWKKRWHDPCGLSISFTTSPRRYTNKTASQFLPLATNMSSLQST